MTAEDDLLREAEHGALGDGHRPELPRPLVYVAEDPLVDRSQVGQVVAGRNGHLLEEDQRRVGDLPLCSLKFSGGAQPELVVQDSGNWVTVRIPANYDRR